MQSTTVDVHWLLPRIIEFIYRGDVLAADLAAGVRLSVFDNRKDALAFVDRLVAEAT
jgi:hypothetical protein